MVSVAIVSVLWVLSLGAVWSVLLLGGLAWIISVALKFAWAIPLNKPIINFLKSKLPANLAGPISWTYIGLLTGIFECGVALAFVLKFPMLGQANWQNALAFGIGFGAMEALLLGLLALWGVGYHKFRPESIPKEEMNKWEITSNRLLMIPIPIAERIFTLFIHIFTKVLIILAVQQNNYILFWYSFGFKSMVDAIAGWMHLEKDIRNVTKASQMWAFQSIFMILALISSLGIRLLQKI